MNLVVKDALWQIIGRVASAIGGFLVIKLITPYLGPLRFGDYSTILKFFAIWSAFADFGIYVLALKQLGKIKSDLKDSPSSDLLETTYGKFVSTRFFMIGVVYTLALVVAYLIPAYTSNPYLVRGLPLGMLFSASFMGAGIVQLPLQLFRKMKQLTIGLILARVGQLVVIALTVYFLFTSVDFSEPTAGSITPFVWILGSVFVSGLIQAMYVWWTGKRFLPLKWIRDRSFTTSILKQNRQYGIAYYLSSFHTLIVLILLSIFYPTAQGYTLVGIWALALGLIEILLIIPSALGNSLIHDVAGSSREQMMKKFGNLLTLIIWIGGIIIINFTIFAPHIIGFVGGEKFLSSTTLRGSDTLLPFLAIILTLSFIKQVFNYIFVSCELQNKLLKINLLGVIVGITVGLPLIIRYGLQGGLITQAVLEVLFVIGALRVAARNKTLPSINGWIVGAIIFATILISWIGIQTITQNFHTLRQRLAISLILTLTITATSYALLKKVIRGLS